MESFENTKREYEMYRKMSDELMKKYDEYSLEDEIYDLTKAQKNMIVGYVKNFALEHIKKYGYINDDNYTLYIILEILRYFGIEMYVGVDVTEIDKYQNRFENVIKKCNMNFINDIKSATLYN